VRGRIRTVKPELFTDERLWDLGVETGLPVLQAFIGLWCFADREGRFEWRPRALRAMVLPFWNGDFDAVLVALASRSFIVRYTVDGNDYGYIRTFAAHQVVPHREAQSTIPAPALHGQSLMPGHDSAVPVQDALACPGGREGKGMEWNGRGREGDARVHVDATALHRERTDPPSHSRPARVITMPSEHPPQEYLDEAVMRGVSPEQARSTWEYYWSAGLPANGVEKLSGWLLKRAKERAASTAKVARAGPQEALQRVADRVSLLRAQETEEERQRAAGGNG